MSIDRSTTETKRWQVWRTAETGKSTGISWDFDGIWDGFGMVWDCFQWDFPWGFSWDLEWDLERMMSLLMLRR